MFLHSKRMDRNKFEQMMAKWAEEEQQTMPELRPTREMYRKVKARRQSSWFPFVNRWATVGVAAIALIVSILVLRPQLFQPSKEIAPSEKNEQFIGESLQEDVLDEGRDHPRPPAPNEGEAPVLQRGEVVLESESAEPASEEEGAEDFGSSVSDPKDRAFSREKKEDSRLEQASPLDKQRIAPAIPDEAPKPAAPAPEPLQAPRRNARPRMMLQENTEGMDEVPALKSAASQAVPAPEKRKGLASGPHLLADDMEQEESGFRILNVPGRQDSNGIVPKLFESRAGIWIDREHDAEKELIHIKRNSPAFRELLEAKPELQAYTDRYEHIIINLGSHSVEISDSGKSELSPEERHALFQ